MTFLLIIIPTDISNIVDIHKSLMKKRNIKQYSNLGNKFLLRFYVLVNH